MIPIYNHGETLAQVVREVEPLGLPCLIVDDGSDEATRKVLDMLEASLEWVDVTRRPTNGGKGAALQSGYRSIWTSMARAYVRSGRLREAYKTLKDSALDAAQLAELALDPDFAPLVESPRYRDVFE